MKRQNILITILIVLILVLAGRFVLAQPDKPVECVELKADVALIKTGTTGVAPNLAVQKIKVTYKKDLIISDRSLGQRVCHLLEDNQQIAETDQCITDVVLQTAIGAGNDIEIDTTAFPNNGGACYTKDFGIVVMLSTISNITNWIFYLLMIAVTLMIIYGGFIYITSAGDPTKAGKGKTVLSFAIIGLAIALLARIIPSIVKFVLGVS